jgi:hypothetical protein
MSFLLIQTDFVKKYGSQVCVLFRFFLILHSIHQKKLLVIEDFSILLHECEDKWETIPTILTHRNLRPSNRPFKSSPQEFLSPSNYRFHFTTIDLTGHGETQMRCPVQFPDNVPLQWSLFGDDVFCVIEDLIGPFATSSHLPSTLSLPLERKEQGDIVIGMGVSLGATSMIYAASSYSNLFQHLILIEPIISPLPTQFNNTQMIQEEKSVKPKIFESLLAKKALQRRNVCNFLCIFLVFHFIWYFTLDIPIKRSSHIILQNKIPFQRVGPESFVPLH